MAKQKQNNQTDLRTMRRIFYYFWLAIRQNKVRTVILFITIPIHVVCSSIIMPIYASQIIGQLGTGDTDFNHYVPSIIAFISFLLIREVAIRITDWLDWSLDARGGYFLSQLCFDKLINQSMTFHSNKFSGSLTSQAGKLSNAYIRFKSSFNWSIYPLFLSIIFTIITIWTVSPLYALIVLGFVIIFITIASITYSKTRSVEIALPQSEIKQTGQLADSITNILNVKSYAHENHERDRYAKASKGVYTATMNVAKTSFWRNGLLNFITGIMLVVFLFIIITGSNTLGFAIGDVVLLYTLTTNIINHIWDTSNILRDINRTLGDAAEMVKILDTPTEIEDHTDRPLVVSSAEIDFHNITFQHSDSKTPLFENFSLKINAGERIGLVGISGSGKTTLTKLLLRFSDVQKGEILIDGQDISSVTQHSLRESIAYVPQETLLFHRSIAENIAYGKPNASRDEIERVAHLASADDFIEKMPEGYETLAGERGNKLSGGQRQRVAIARAFLKDAPILILDEATSALDSESEAAIQKATERLMKGRTSIVVAHRLSTIANLDRIVVLKDGKIIEQGSHRQLLLHDGPYKHLWSRQTGAFFESEDNG